MLSLSDTREEVEEGLPNIQNPVQLTRPGGEGLGSQWCGSEAHMVRTGSIYQTGQP